jgi:hypothetical protein
MPAGDRSVIVEHWPDEFEFTRRKSPGEVSVVQRLPPAAPDPTQQQLDAFASVYSRYGGYATARVVDWFWFGFVVLTPEQQRAAAGLP